jgi:hypothetical protein
MVGVGMERERPWHSVQVFSIVPSQYFRPAREIVVCESMLRAVSLLWRLCKVDMDVFLFGIRMSRCSLST